MIRTPRKPHSACTCGTCRVCTDPLIVGLVEIRESFADRGADDRLGGHRVTVSASLAKVFLPPVHRPPVPAPSFTQFDDDFAALRARVRGDGMQPRTSERGDR